MDKQRKNKQRRNKRLGKLVRTYVEHSEKLVDDMRQRVNQSTTKPVNWVSTCKKVPSLSRKKRIENKMGRLEICGLFVVNDNLQDGLRKGYDLRGGIWSSSVRKWFFTENLNNVR